MINFNIFNAILKKILYNVDGCLIIITVEIYKFI